MIIRPAGTEDLAALAALARQTYADAFGHSFSPSDLAAHLERNLADSCFRQAMAEDVFLLAEAAGRPIGFVQFGPVRIAVASASSRDQELRRIYVLGEFQNRGIGRRLMDTALDHPRLKAADVYLDVWEQNHIARRLYESYGFTVIGAHSLVTASGIAQDQDLIMVRRQSRITH
jgi:ribosomal protein S18 acetylase RimI-like enzyme